MADDAAGERAVADARAGEDSRASSGCVPPSSQSTPISSAARIERSSSSRSLGHDLEHHLAAVGPDGRGESAVSSAIGRPMSLNPT